MAHDPNIRLSKELEDVIASATDEARQERHAAVSPTHLFWALLFDDRVRRILALAGADLERLDDELDRALAAEEKLAAGGELVLSAGFEAVVARAARHAFVVGRDALDVLDVLGAFCRAKRADARDILASHGVSSLDVLVALCHGLTRADALAKANPAIPMGARDLWIVVFHNDDYTTQPFVVAVLREVFELPREAADELMKRVHERGRADIGTFTARHALRLVAETMRRARAEDMPLLVTAERAVSVYR